jgi:putative ATP-dependent endonuclease of OLD family
MAEHIKSKSNGQITLDELEVERLLEGYSPVSRALMGRAARNSKNGWFKSISAFQEVAKDIVGPNLANAEPGFVQLVTQLWEWTSAAT